MYREVLETLPINIINDDGGLGDAIARLPAFKYISTTHPHVKATLWVQDFFKQFAIHMLRETNIEVKAFEELKTIKPHKARTFSRIKHNNLSSHLTDHAFSAICNVSVDIEHKNYLRPDFASINIEEFQLPEKYVVMTSGFTANSREFYPGYVNSVVDYIKQKGYDVVFLGQTVTKTGVSHIIKGNFSDKIDYSKGINLINRTDLLEASKIIQHAKAIVGLDNGLLHLAGCTDTPIVGGFTTVDPKHRMPYRNNVLGYNFYPVVPPDTLKCRFCQSNWIFAYENDFKECYYKDYACVTQLKPELYIEQLEKIL